MKYKVKINKDQWLIFNVDTKEKAISLAKKMGFKALKVK
jgi:hypothetical protein